MGFLSMCPICLDMSEKLKEVNGEGFKTFGAVLAIIGAPMIVAGFFNR